MIIQNFPFITPSNYTFDSNKVEITGGKAQLKLIDNPGNDFQEDFADDTDFTYDSDLAEFSGGQVQQKDQTPADAQSWATYTNDINLNYGNGILTGVGVGSPSITDNKLDLTGETLKYVDYNANLNADSQQTGCIKFKLTPNYSGAPASLKQFFTISKANGFNDNSIKIYQSGTLIFIQISNSIGGNIVSNAESWSPVSGTTYEIELNYDITTGATRLFIDGNQIGSTQTGTGTRSSDIGLLRIGADQSATLKSDFYIEDLVIYDTVQHTSNYTPGYTLAEAQYVASDIICPEMEYIGAGTLVAVTAFTTSFGGSPRLTLEIGRSGDELYWNGSAWVVSNETYAQATDPATFAANATSLPVNGEIYGQFKIYFTDSNLQSSFSDLLITLTAQIYPVDNPTVEINSRWYLDDLEALTEASTKTGSDEIKYILKKGDTWYWFNSGVLEESDGTYSQANTAAEIETYKALFTSIKIYFAILLFLHSENGQTTPDIDTLTAQYSYAGDTPDSIDTCLVWGTQLDAEGNPSTDTIYIQLIDSAVQYKNTTVINREVITITPDSTGYWEAELIENANMVGNQGYKFTIDEYNYYKVVPNEETKAFFDLTDWS